MKMKSQILTSRQGFTLIELAIVLVIVGILVGLGSSMVGVLTTAIKVRETKDFLDANVQAIASYASSHNSIPDAAGFTGAAKSPQDSWGRDFIYLFDANLHPADITKDTICGRRSTALTLRNCLTTNAKCAAGGGGVVGTDFSDTSNVAFVVLSKSDDAKTDTTASDAAINASRAATGTVTTDSNNSDIVRWVTLDELRSKIGCQGAPLKILNNELPYGQVGTAYTATLTADGGVPFALAPSTYRWCVNTLPAGFTTPPAGGIANANCLNATEGDWGATVASANLTIAFTAAAPPAAGSYQITVVARDNADASAGSAACSAANPGDNCTVKTFVITVNPF